MKIIPDEQMITVNMIDYPLFSFYSCSFSLGYCRFLLITSGQEKAINCNTTPPPPNPKKNDSNNNRKMEIKEREGSKIHVK